MSDNYFNLKLKLEELGYNNTLPIEGVPLVECLLADLMQTTRSLQHYMDLSQEALMQRDSLMMEAEPYRCDNARLIQENSQLHREVMELKEEILKISKEKKRKEKALVEDLTKKESTISKLQHELRDLSLRGLCAGTQSSRNKSRRKDCGDESSKMCICAGSQTIVDKDIIELTNKIHSLEEHNQAYNDEIILLKNQVEHRDDEIIRLNILLEGRRQPTAINRDCCKQNSELKIQDVTVKLCELQTANDLLKKEIDAGREKQHEAMLRALNLADKNNALHSEMKKVDALALKVEEDCNKRLATMMNELNTLQSRLECVLTRNTALEMELQGKKDDPTTNTSVINLKRLQESLDIALQEKQFLQDEIKCLKQQYKNLQEIVKSQANKEYSSSRVNQELEPRIKETYKCPTRDELQKLLESERKKYEKHMTAMQDKLTETMTMFNEHLNKCDNKDKYSRTMLDSEYMKDLHNKLCESEQKLLMLKKENDDLKARQGNEARHSKENYKDIVAQLNAENSELSKENILLSQKLSYYKNIGMSKSERGDTVRRDIVKLKNEIETLRNESQLLRKDKHEYNTRYKESMDLVDKLRRDLSMKQKEVEQLNEENCSYKMTNRNGRASAEHLREECNFLREQIKKMQSDVIKEKTMASQIKNIQLETERSSNEIQNELLCSQKKLSISKDTVDTLEKKCKELQAEISSLKNDKSNLIDSIKKVDQERDKLVIELDHKTEANCVLEQKIKSQSYEINKLEDEISDLNRKFNINKVSEHKLIDTESQLKFLNGEIMRLTQQYDNAVMENKHLLNNLADAHGALKLNKIELEKSKKDVEGLKQQLQHYVAEIRRIEEMLSHKEAERSDMLEHFASLSVEANILENTNHSLESESASKSLQLQNYIIKIQDLESKLLDKEAMIDNQSSRIAAMLCKITSQENEIKLITEEKLLLEQNVAHLKQMCNNLQCGHTGLGNTDSELQLYENKIRSLTTAKSKVESEKQDMRETLSTTEKLLSNARKEIIELKLALQDATTETKLLKDNISHLSAREMAVQEVHERTMTREEYNIPFSIEDTINEVSQEEDESSSHYHRIQKRYSSIHSSTL